MDTARRARGAFDSLSGEMHASVSGVLASDSRHLRDALLGRMRRASCSGARPEVALAGARRTSVAGRDTSGRMALGAFAGDDTRPRISPSVDVLDERLGNLGRIRRQRQCRYCSPQSGRLRLGHGCRGWRRHGELASPPATRTPTSMLARAQSSASTSRATYSGRVRRRHGRSIPLCALREGVDMNSIDKRARRWCSPASASGSWRRLPGANTGRLVAERLPGTDQATAGAGSPSPASCGFTSEPTAARKTVRLPRWRPPASNDVV